MKKWYAITGILVLLLVISISTCSSNSAEVDRVKDELASARGELADAKAELRTVEADLRAAKDNLVDVSEELDEVRSELAQLKATKEISFGNGLRVFDIEYGDYYVQGKIQNVSSTSMHRVTVLVAFYNYDGSFGGYGTDTVSDLFAQEAAEWKVSESFYGSWSGEAGLVDIYAIGDRSD